MPLVSAIFDNTVFNIAARIHCCDLIRLASNLFDKILVPLEISNELQRFPPGIEPHVEKRMQAYFRQILPREKGLQLCTTYDPVVKAMLQYEKNVHLGEAEALAQAEKRGTKWFFTDDEICIKALRPKYSHIHFASTYQLIACLDVAGFLPDYQQVVKEFLVYKPLPQKGKSRRDKLRLFREDYAAACRYFDLQLDKKLIGRKTSFKQYQ